MGVSCSKHRGQMVILHAAGILEKKRWTISWPANRKMWTTSWLPSIYIYMYTHARTHTYIHTSTHTHTAHACEQVHTHAHARTRTYAQTDTTHTHTHTRRHENTNTHTHTHTHKQTIRQTDRERQQTYSLTHNLTHTIMPTVTHTTKRARSHTRARPKTHMENTYGGRNSHTQGRNIHAWEDTHTWKTHTHTHTHVLTHTHTHTPTCTNRHLLVWWSVCNRLIQQLLRIPLPEVWQVPKLLQTTEGQISNLAAVSVIASTYSFRKCASRCSSSALLFSSCRWRSSRNGVKRCVSHGVVPKLFSKLIDPLFQLSCWYTRSLSTTPWWRITWFISNHLINFILTFLVWQLTIPVYSISQTLN